MTNRPDPKELNVHFFTTKVEEPAATLKYPGFVGTYEDACDFVDKLLTAQGNCVVWDVNPFRATSHNQTERHCRQRVVIVKDAITMVSIQLIEPTPSEEKPNEN